MAFCRRDKADVKFDVTPVENLFIQEYMVDAPGDYVKVYLCALMQSRFPAAAEPQPGEIRRRPAHGRAGRPRRPALLAAPGPCAAPGRRGSGLRPSQRAQRHVRRGGERQGERLLPLQRVQ